jgi:hypothetical protein
MLDKVCDALIAGDSLTHLCKDPDMPSEASVYRAMAKDDEVARIIARARECPQDAEIDRTVAMVDAATEPITTSSSFAFGRASGGPQSLLPKNTAIVPT